MMSPERGVTILLSTLFILASTGFVWSIESHSYNAAGVFFGVDVVLFGVFATIRPKLVMRALREALDFIEIVLDAIVKVLQIIAHAVVEWQRRRKAKKTNPEILYLQKHAAPDLMYSLGPLDFEDYVLRLFRVRGYKAEGTKASGDGGVDGKLWRKGKLYLVQCKCYQEKLSVGEPPVRDLLGAVTKAKAAGGFFVTTSHFTPTADRFANGKSIELISGKALADRIKAIRITDPIDRVTI